MMIPEKESLQIEFKSDKKKLPDREIVQAAVGLANTEGGRIFLGVEDDGRVTGLHAEHMNPTSIAALIANRTVPSLSVRVSVLRVHEVPIAVIEVPKSFRLTATSDGTLLRRRLLADGKPQCVPFLPHEFASRESDLRLIDYSALPVTGLETDALDPVERERVRQLIERYAGDRSLLGLADPDFDGALGFTRTESGRRLPTVTGMLLIGRESVLGEHLSTHEVAFQVLRGTDVETNDFYRLPLARLFDRIDEQFRARVVEREVQAGLFRVAVPTVDYRAFREAFVNAVTHRDYSRLGAVHIRWQDNLLIISSPGGFVDGVTPENILTVEPKPRNPLLADAFKRIGLAERTGRGVDLIYQGLLRYGRPAPNYYRSDSNTVIVELSCGEADLEFLAMVLEEERRRSAPLPVDTLLVLWSLRQCRRCDAAELAESLHKDIAAIRAVIEPLVESGLVKAHGVKKGRTYTLGPAVYRRLGQAVEYVRQAGFDRIQQEQMVLNFVDANGLIRRKDVMELCGLGEDQANRLLRLLVKRGALARTGTGKPAFYTRA